MHDVNYRNIVRTDESDMISRNEDHHIRMKADGSTFSPERTQDIIAKDNATRRLILSHVPTGVSPSDSVLALDMGVGAGGSFEPLREKFDYIDGIDVVTTFFPQLPQYASLQQCPIEKLQQGFTDNTIDCVFSAHVMEHTYNLHKTLDGIWHVLKPGGYVAAITPHYFPDPEIAHICQLGLEQWRMEYEMHDFEIVAAYINQANCEECHIVARKPS
jgi:2-polyprenyl-3-methyl-5-hydroxy-6-metoxy-1,4-benzoquinol methylase